MVKHYLKMAWRTMTLNRTYSITNLVGLFAGLLVIMLISGIVADELSYDTHWTHQEELYRLRTNYLDEDGNSNMVINGAEAGLAKALVREFPEIQDATTINPLSLKLMIDSSVNRYAEINILESDSNFFDLFDTKLIVGNPKKRIAQATNLVITESAQKRYFDGKDIMGKIFYNIPDEGEALPYIVTAILKDLPQNTHLHADALVLSPAEEPFVPNQAGGNSGQYIRVKKATAIPSLEKKIDTWLAQQKTDVQQSNKSIKLQAIADVHLRTETGWESPMRDIYILIGISALILLLVCINFVNLTFAHAIKRTADTGVRKVLGASRKHLIFQMAAESMLLFGASFVLGFIGYVLVIPALETYLGHSLTLTFYRSAPLFVMLLIGWLAIGITCSLFPAITLAKVKAADGIRKNLLILKLPLKTGFTKALIIVQFSIAMIVSICMLTIKAQLQFMDEKDLGYDPKDLLVLDGTSWEGKSKVFKETLLQNPNIQAVSLTQWTPFSGSANILEFEYPESPNKKEGLVLLDVDFDFVKTMGSKILSGRTLNDKYALDAIVSDSIRFAKNIYQNILVSETTAKKHFLKINESSETIKYTPVGIFQDFHGASLRFDIAPIAIRVNENLDYASLLVRAKEGKKKEALAAVNAQWKAFFPNRIPRMNWIEDQVKQQYDKERKQFQQLAFFSTISVLLSLLGVLGIAVYTLERKVKEIGIRKVLGASAATIVMMLSNSFTKLAFLAIILAFPIAWWLMHKWLTNFAFRIDIPIFLFIETALFICLCTFALVGIRSLSAAKANPVDSLREE